MHHICFSDKFIDRSPYFHLQKNRPGHFHLNIQNEKVFERVLTGDYPRKEIKNSIDNLAKESGVKKEVVFKNIEIVENRNTFFVAAGHQLNIMLGPAFYLTKIISLIQFTRHIQSQYPEYTFIPLFWLAAEDHDLKEISENYLFGKKFIIEIDKEYDNTPAGDLIPGAFLKSLKESLAGFRWNEDQKKWLNFFIHVYDHSRNLTQATTAILYELFGDNGLLVLDARHSSLKKYALSIFEREINEQLIFNTLNQFKYLNPLPEWPVNPREINLFYIHEGKRKRISFNAKEKDRTDVFIPENKVNFLEEIRTFPEKISPNVLMRPLYQQKILPCVAYVAGPSEADYWTQMLPLFEQLNIPFPILILRPQYIFVNQAFHKFLFSHNISYSQLVDVEKEKLMRLLIQHQLPEHYFIQLKNHLHADMNNLMDFAQKMDFSLYQYLESEKTKMTNQVLQIQEKLVRSVKKKNEDTLNKFSKIYDKLLPSGMPNERLISSFEILSELNLKNLWLTNAELSDIFKHSDRFSFVFLIN
jgi:bacillithiol biosynthesis cysteine-adding enzyme BshC